MNKYLLTIISLILLSNSMNSEVSPEQAALLENLPADQRAAALEKLKTADNLQSEINDIFDGEPNLINRSETDIEEKLAQEKLLQEICPECIFGYSFFQNSPSSFALATNSPVTSDYILGPGDKLQINLFGTEQRKLEVYVSREGLVFIPPMGPVSVVGKEYGEAIAHIKERVENELLGTQVSVTMIETRPINIYMLGEAYKPGRYTLSGMSTVINALFVTGGVNEQGSLRNIQIKRNSDVVGTYDFYNFLLKGVLDSEIKLLDGDIIFIPFIENRVFINGAFKRPGIYEFLPGENISDAIALAGGFKSDVISTDLEISFIDKSKSERNYINVTSSEFEKKLENSFVINATSKSGLTSETISVSGEVDKPGEYSIRPGDRINDILNRAGGITNEGYSEGAVFLRKSVSKMQEDAFERNANDLENTLLDIVTNNTVAVNEFAVASINQLINKLRSEEPLGRMVVDLDYLSLKNQRKNFRVRGGDSLYIPKRPETISIVGEVLNAATLTFDPDNNVYDYLNIAGGLKDSADKDNIFIIFPNGKAEIVQRSFFNSNNVLIPGSTVVVPRDSRPFDAINLTQIITPILADLATSAAAIAAISD